MIIASYIYQILEYKYLREKLFYSSVCGICRYFLFFVNNKLSLSHFTLDMAHSLMEINELAQQYEWQYLQPKLRYRRG